MLAVSLAETLVEMTKLGPKFPRGTWRLERFVDDDGSDMGDAMVMRDATGRMLAMMHPDDFEALRKELAHDAAG